MDLDRILIDLGQFGRYQVIIFILLFFPLVFTNIGNITYIFTAGDVEYRCFIPECERSTSDPFEKPWLQWALPHRDDENRDQCLRYKSKVNPFQQNCSEETFSTSETELCHTFVFRNNENTITKEFNLLCGENKWKRTIVGTLNTIAQLVATPLTGIVSDRYGRRTLILTSVLLSSLFGTMRSFATSYDQFVMLEMLDAMSYSGVYTAVYVFGIEILGPDKRGLGGTIISCFASMSGIILGITVWLVDDWRHYLRLIYMPGFLFIIYYWIFPESLRWSMTHERNKEVIETLSQISVINKKPLTENIKKYICKMAAIQGIIVEKPIMTEMEISEKNHPLWALISSKIMVFRVLNCSFCWITHTFVYNGLSMASLLFSGDKHLNFILSCLIEIPAYLFSWLFVDRCGRKVLLIFGLVTSGLSCTAFHFVAHDAVLARLLLFLLGKLAITVSFTAMYVMSSEFYPTNLRNSLVGFSSTIGRIGSMAAPQTALLAEYIDPFLAFGVISLLAGFLGLHFPETRDTKLPDTIEEAKCLGRKRSKLKKPRNLSRLSSIAECE